MTRGKSTEISPLITRGISFREELHSTQEENILVENERERGRIDETETEWVGNISMSATSTSNLPKTKGIMKRKRRRDIDSSISGIVEVINSFFFIYL